MAYRVLITEPIVDTVIQRLKEHYRVDVGERGAFNTEQQLIESIPLYDALLPMLSNPVTGQVIEAGKNLKVIANHAVGYNNIDLDAARENKVKVANTPDVLTESSADLAMALLLAVARKIFQAQQYLKAGKFEGWEPLGFLGIELHDNTLGIVGMGRIGTAVARRAKAFGMNIVYHNRSPVSKELQKELDATYLESVTELARRSDVLSLHCPLTEETHHLIDKKVLAELPDHAIIVNTARGPVIDEAALAEALHNREIGGAGLDVFENEPKIHPKILTAPNCVITPHIASATHQSRKAIGMLAADAIIGVLEGKPDKKIPNLIQL